MLLFLDSRTYEIVLLNNFFDELNKGIIPYTPPYTPTYSPPPLLVDSFPTTTTTAAITLGSKEYNTTTTEIKLNTNCSSGNIIFDWHNNFSTFKLPGAY